MNDVTCLRVMSFIIAGRIATEDAAENAWSHRAPLNVVTILRPTPDLTGFQKLDDCNLQTHRE
jgi:hypothetical protein